jgi:hypothetical protein
MIMNDTTKIPPPPMFLSSASSSSKVSATTTTKSSSAKLPPTTIRSNDNHQPSDDYDPYSSKKVNDDATDNVVHSSPQNHHLNHPRNTRLHFSDMDVICGRGKAGFNHRTYGVLMYLSILL